MRGALGMHTLYIYITFLYDTHVCVCVCVSVRVRVFEVFIFYPILITKFYLIHGFFGHKLFSVQNLIYISFTLTLHNVWKRNTDTPEIKKEN